MRQGRGKRLCKVLRRLIGRGSTTMERGNYHMRTDMNRQDLYKVFESLKGKVNRDDAFWTGIILPFEGEMRVSIHWYAKGTEVCFSYME